METTHETALPKIDLRHFQADDTDRFFAMAEDPAIKEYFAELGGDPDINRYKFGRINDEIPVTQYWGIFLPDGNLAGFVSLNKNGTVYQFLEEQATAGTQTAEDDLKLEAEETREEATARKWQEKLAAPYAAEVALREGFRGRGIARAAMKALIRYAGASGLDRLYFEVRTDNTDSLKLISRFAPEKINMAPTGNGHDIYRLDLRFSAPDKEEIKARVAECGGTLPEGYNLWREMVAGIPELAAHEELVCALMAAFKAKKVTVHLRASEKYCHFTTEWGLKEVTISLQRRAEDPLSIIWSMAHEYGHACQEPASPAEQQLYSRENYLREADAWDKAEAWLKDKPYFMHQWPDFIRLRNRRLEKYLPVAISAPGNPAPERATEP